MEIKRKKKTKERNTNSPALWRERAPSDKVQRLTEGIRLACTEMVRRVQETGRALKPPPSSSWKQQTFYLAESAWGDSEEPLKGPIHHCVGAYIYIHIILL